MKISFLNNGMDSLRKGYDFLRDYEISLMEKSELGSESITEEDRYYLLKDAILAIHHGVEVLLKSILFEKSEYLVFTELNRHVQNAFIEKRNKKLDSVFETSLKDKIHTINYDESRTRVEAFCGFTIPKKLNQKLEDLQNYRNLITHSEINLNENDIAATFEDFLDVLDGFFFNAIGQKYKTLNGYSELQKNYEDYSKELLKRKLQLKKVVMDVFMHAFKQNSIGMGEHEVKIISDINIATSIIESLNKEKLIFGVDLYNGYCSGHVSIRRINDTEFSFFTHDNNADFRFKFKRLLIYLPKIIEPTSPILFFESDDMKVESEWQQNIVADFHGRKVLSGLCYVEEGRETYDQSELYAFENKIEYDPDYIIPNYYRIEKFLSRGVFGFANVQGLKYGSVERILQKFKDRSLKDLEVSLRETLNEKA